MVTASENRNVVNWHNLLEVVIHITFAHTKATLISKRRKSAIVPYVTKMDCWLYLVNSTNSTSCPLFMLSPPYTPGMPSHIHFFIHSIKTYYSMLLKSTGSEVRLSGFKVTALSLLAVSLWENHLTSQCLYFLISYPGLIIFPTSRAVVKIQ